MRAHEEEKECHSDSGHAPINRVEDEFLVHTVLRILTSLLVDVPRNEDERTVYEINEPEHRR